MRALTHPAPADITLAGLCHALGDPVRLGMVQRMAGGGIMPCNALCDALPRSTLSFHLRVLREAGLVRSERRGKTIVNALRRADVEARFPGLLDTLLEAADKDRTLPGVGARTAMR